LHATIDTPAGAVHLWRLEVDPAAARLALRQILARCLGGDPDGAELRAGEHGKPMLAERPPRLRFNLSHSADLALVAVSAECEVGVDVERERGGRDFVRLAGRGLDPQTHAAVRAAAPEDRAATFYAAWVRREAVAKCAGAGLGAPLPDRPISVLGLEVATGHAAALAVAAPPDAMLPTCQTRPPGKVARLGAGKALAPLSSAAASSARTSSPS
jgi:hypothetical protein